MIPHELLRGCLKTLLLQILLIEGPMHGYALVNRLEIISNGRIKVPPGSIYPVLHKLEKEKILVNSTSLNDNRTRIYYALTLKGKSFAKKKINEMNEFIECIQLIMNIKSSN